MRIYLAGPLFSEAERDWMKKLKTQIERFAAESGMTGHVVWPYELITQPEIEQLGVRRKMRSSFAAKRSLVNPIFLLPFWTALRWMMGQPGRSGTTML